MPGILNFFEDITTNPQIAFQYKNNPNKVLGKYYLSSNEKRVLRSKDKQNILRSLSFKTNYLASNCLTSTCD